MDEWSRNPAGNYACPCCGYHTLTDKPPGSYDICKVCFWEDDGVQFEDHSYRGGANDECLNEARAEFETKFAKGELRSRHCRFPNDDERPRLSWAEREKGD